MSFIALLVSMMFIPTLFFSSCSNDQNLENEVKLVETGCFGLCALGPVVVVYPEGAFYSCVQVEDVAEIVDSKPFDGVAKRLSELLCFTGNLDVDLMVDSAGDFYILEMNCRFGGQYPFTHEAGANYVRFLIDAVRGNDQKTIPMVEIGAKFSKDIVPVRIK